MSCKICGRGACCESFHSFEEQNEFEQVELKVKDNIRSILSKKKFWAETEDGKPVLVVSWSDVEDIL